MDTRPNVFERLRDVVREVPPGHVATYGQVSAQVLGTIPRHVGYALAGLPEDTDVPWHRIVNAEGRVSLPRDAPGHAEQVRRLCAEGVRFDEDETIDLETHGWLWI